MQERTFHQLFLTGILQKKITYLCKTQTVVQRDPGRQLWSLALNDNVQTAMGYGESHTAKRNA